MKLTCELCVICHTVQLAASDCDFVIVTAKVHATIDVCCFVPNGFQMAILLNKCTVLCSAFTRIHNPFVSHIDWTIDLLLHYLAN